MAPHRARATQNHNSAARHRATPAPRHTTTSSETDHDIHQEAGDRRDRRGGDAADHRRLRAAKADHARVFAGGRGERVAHGEHRVGEERGEGGRHQPEILGRAAKAGEPDPRDPLVHRAEGGRHRILAGRRVGLGAGADRSEGGAYSGDPDRSRRRREGPVAVRDDDRFRLPRGRAARGPLARRALQERRRPDQHRRAAGHGRLGAGQRPPRGPARGDQEQSEVQGDRVAKRRLHARRRQAGDGSVRQDLRQADQRRLRAQRRHGARRDPGDGGGRHQARQGRERRVVRRDQGRLPGDGRGQDQRRRRMQPAARPAADDRREGGGGRQAAAEADRHERDRVPDERRRAGAADPQVLSVACGADGGRRAAVRPLQRIEGDP
ncbi:hypothetical protein BVI1335_1650060 [Burkholderia vietnamiensis]|nr:hypothetical protein BVI1335_1650060 [Burkholderia vietnamiensis]